MQKKVGIIGAMKVEVDYLKSKLEGTIKETKAGAIVFTEGAIEGTPVVVVQSGVGKVNAALCAQRLVLEFAVTHVINTGVAGAAAEGLRILDFVVSSDALYHDMDATEFGYKRTVIPQMDTSDFQADDAMIRAAKEAFATINEAQGKQLVVGRIASGDQFIGAGERKREIIEVCSPACVEMEGAAVAHACYLCGVPFVVIRCMSDMADESVAGSYSFNEAEAATLSSHLVLSMLGKF